ncbi:conserved hypothetical protein [Methanosalsum zhilinae DSM 4017]|uniref:Uncharacterized protein n=1 Tax=Methanosalsum zhilinae (strain DSM 4017 / NBRC 107636 / OCM 62 / WeN5) TaxID=679901 RepID=F7XM33_METZD|nr:hypothetical protein [Methanosalsum zhilinae]AEH61297.1 conserved hypothetical protein [Methanosalsum zhilinae DSM 4017]
MPAETHLIKIKDTANLSQIEGVIRILAETGARVDIVANRNIIATFNSVHADRLRNNPHVQLVGAVNFRGRKVKRIVKKTSGIN